MRNYFYLFKMKKRLKVIYFEKQSLV